MVFGAAIVGANYAPSGPRDALAKWPPELKAMKPAIAAAAAQVNDAAHRCGVCGQVAHFGCDVRIQQGEEGRWFCAAHRPQGAGTA
jgi:hypothetical protein